MPGKIFLAVPGGGGASYPYTPADVAGSTGPLTVLGGTLTGASTPVLNLTQTWNNAATTFTGELINITDTASNAASLIKDWQVGGVSKALLVKSGTFGGNSFQSSSFQGYLTTAQALAGSVGSSVNGRVFNFGGAIGGGYRGSIFDATSVVSWSSVTATAGADGANPAFLDLALARDAAGVLAQKNLTNAQEFRVYKSTTGTQYKALLGDGNLIKIAGYAFTNGAGASTGTLTNAPAVGNPTKWIPIDDNGTTRYIPAW